MIGNSTMCDCKLVYLVVSVGVF